MRTSANTLTDSKTKKTAPADKGTDKKVLTRKPDGSTLKSLNSKNTLIKTKSSPSVVNKANATPMSKKNVMNTTHNVTVASPPSSASKNRSASTPDIKQAAPVKSVNHSRTRTRTIDPKDSFLHQKKLLSKQVKEKEPVRDPVAFEINFEDTKPLRKVDPPEDDDYNYESDFESYESDFEPEVPSTTASSEKLNESEGELEVVEPVQIDKTMSDKEHVDSGSYEMSTKKPSTPPSTHCDSIDDTVNSHDSGISYDDQTLHKKLSKTCELYKRGEELMKKITFDEVSFNIFETKPVAYETFMSLYGRQMNMFQASTQSESMQMVDEVQTEPIMKTEVWTQFPAKFTPTGLQFINSKLYNEEKLGVGEELDEQTESTAKDEREQFSQFIYAINNFSKSEETINNKSLTLNTAQLHRFAENAALTISSVIDNQSKQQGLNPSKISISRGFMQLKLNEIEVLHDTVIKKLFTNPSISNFLVTIHKRKNSVQNIVCLWDVLSTKRPMKIFNSWSDVTCIIMHDQQRDVIVGGCNDGTICLWDVQEFSEWRDGNENTSIIKPCEVISLNQLSNDFSHDNVVSLKSLPFRDHKSKSGMFSQSRAVQICSLHRNGTVIIWTISRLHSETFKESNLDYIHTKSRVRLIKNVVIDLNTSAMTTGNENENPRGKSAFEKTRYYFENDLFSDKVLRELQEIDTSRNKTKPSSADDLIKFNGCTAGLNEIFLASDLNFILAVSRLNLGVKTRKIFTNESSFISPTSILIHPVNSNVLAVGSANGEVKFIKIHDDDNDLNNNSLKNTRKSTDEPSVSDIVAKSCAFQNIVKKEKKLYDETQALNNLDSEELNSFLLDEALSKELFANDSARKKLKVPFDKNVFNSFEVSHGSVISIEFNKTGEFMFILVGKQLKIFNCWTNSEVDQQEKRSLCDVKCVQAADSSEYLVSFIQLTSTFLTELFLSLTDSLDHRQRDFTQ